MPCLPEHVHCARKGRNIGGGENHFSRFSPFQKGIADSSWCAFCENAIPLLYTREPRRRRENWKRRKRQVRGYSQGLSSIIPKASPPAERRSWGENNRLSLGRSVMARSKDQEFFFRSFSYTYFFCARFFLSHMEMCRLARAFSPSHLRGESRKGKEIREKEKISHFSPLSPPPPPPPRRRRKLWESSIGTSREIAKKKSRVRFFRGNIHKEMCSYTPRRWSQSLTRLPLNSPLLCFPLPGTARCSAP